MTDDLKERLRNPLGPEVDGCHLTYAWVIDLCAEALERITDLESCLAESQAAEEGALMILATVTAERDAARARRDELRTALDAALASEDLLMGALRPFAEYLQTPDGRMDRDHHGNPLSSQQNVGWIYLTYGDFRLAEIAIAAYEARRKG